MSGLVILPGQVLRLGFPFSEPPKEKYCLCICPASRLFFVINSKQYRFAPADSQIVLFQAELSCLRHDSYLDVSKVYEFEQRLIDHGAKAGVYSLGRSALERVLFRVRSQRFLPARQQELVLARFAAALE